MKRLNVSIIVFVLLSGIAIAQPQAPDTLWTRTYGGASVEYGYNVQQTSDGGFIIIGKTTSFGAGSQVYLVKTDIDGNQQWYSTFGGLGADEGNSVKQTIDGGYVITGTTMSYGAGNKDVYLIRASALGNQEWYHTFGGDDYDLGYDVEQTSDGGYIIVGSTTSNGAVTGDVFLIKTNSNGHQLWCSTFGGIAYDAGYSIKQTSDGGYIIAGETYSYGAGITDVYLIKTDADGNQQWFNTFGGSSIDAGKSIQQTTDGGYIVAGYTNSYGMGGFNVYQIKTDSIGCLQWNHTFGGNSNDEGYSVQQTIDGGYIITGKIYTERANYQVYLIKTNSFGNQQWSDIIGGSASDEGNSIIQTSDGGYIIAGKTSSYGLGSSDVYLIKFTSESPTPINLTLAPQNPPIQVLAGGGTFNFDIEVENISSTPQIVDIWTNITLPNGSIFGPIINLQNCIYPANWSTSRLKTQSVPANAPSGDYTYNAYIGDYPSVVIVEDHFTFTKLPGEGGNSPYQTWECYESGESIVSPFNLKPLTFDLLSAYPNPFNSSVSITFELPSAGEISLKIFDISGREVQDLGFGIWDLGTHSVAWDAAGQASGIYFARLTAGKYQKTQKLVLIK